MANSRIEHLADSAQSVINTLVGAKRSGRHPIKSLLNGSWLGHPLHPLLTDVAVGGAVLAALFDIAWLALPQTLVWAPRGAEACLLVAVLGMLGSFFSGWTDWSDTYGAERSKGMVHGILNSIVLVLFLISAVLRLQVSTGQSTGAAVFDFVGVALLSVAAFIGGDLVFKFGTNVNHTAWEHGADDFTAIGPLADIPEGQLTRMVVENVPVVLLRHGDKIAVLAATCTHAGGPLDEGDMPSDGVIRCPWHGSRFRMETGKVVDGPATVAQPTYSVRILDGQVEVKRR